MEHTDLLGTVAASLSWVGEEKISLECSWTGSFVYALSRYIPMKRRSAAELGGNRDSC